MHVEALDHIHIYSADPAKSAEFYEHHFDGTIVQRHEEGTVLLALGGKILIFGPVPEGVAPAHPPAFEGGARTPGCGVAHIGLRVADVKAAVDELTQASVEILAQPVVEPDITYAYIGAPDGVVLELTQYEIPA